MSVFDPRNDLGATPDHRAEHQDRLWNTLNAADGGEPEQYARELVTEFPLLTTTQSRILALHKMGWTDSKISAALGMSDQTVYNNMAKMRKLANGARRTPLRVIFRTQRERERERLRKVPTEWGITQRRNILRF